jgi:hypothetical protein
LFWWTEDLHEIADVLDAHDNFDGIAERLPNNDYRATLRRLANDFAAEGTYTVSLRVTDDHGVTSGEDLQPGTPFAAAAAASAAATFKININNTFPDR